MTQKKEKVDLDRRSFLKGASIGAAGGVAMIATSGKAEAMSVSSSAEETGEYSKTEHVAKYYEVARF